MCNLSWIHPNSETYTAPVLALEWAVWNILRITNYIAKNVVVHNAEWQRHCQNSACKFILDAAPNASHNSIVINRASLTNHVAANRMAIIMRTRRPS